MKDNRSAAIAAALIILGTGVVFYYMPAMMEATASVSPWLSMVVAGLFVLAFFAVFWLRARSQRNRDQD